VSDEEKRLIDALRRIEAIHNQPAADIKTLMDQAEQARQIANQAVTHA
jgi:hypothetical protein